MTDILLSFASRGLTGAGWIVWIAFGLVVTQFTIFGVTLYLHRGQTHRGVNFHPALAHFFRFWLWLTTGMITKEWVAVHRKHHAKVETEEDPHSPVIYGIKKVFWDGVGLYRKAAANPQDIQKYGQGTPDDWIERQLYSKHAMAGPSLMFIIDFALFGVVGIAIWAIQMAWIPVWAAGVVNGLGHWWGYRNFASSDTSTNLIPWAVWIGGEELHNNHHAFPSSAKFALRKWEFDIGWLVLRGLEKLKLVTILRVAPSLDIRTDVPLVDTETLKAIATHRFQTLTDYYRQVILPTLREEAGRRGESIKRIAPKRIRLALADGGRWLDQDALAKLDRIVAKRPTLQTVCAFRSQLMALMEQRGSEQKMQSLRQWVREAEASGIQALQVFAQRLKGYQVVPMHT